MSDRTPQGKDQVRTAEIGASLSLATDLEPTGRLGLYPADSALFAHAVTTRARLQAAADHIPVPAETLAGVVAAMLGQRVRPLRLPTWSRPAGLMLTGGGVAVVAAAWRERGPGSLEEPPALVTTGLHSISRNPIYLGCTAVHLGLACATRNGWMLASCPVSAALVHRWVLREERWLCERFGDEYDAYRVRVPRYL